VRLLFLCVISTLFLCGCGKPGGESGGEGTESAEAAEKAGDLPRAVRIYESNLAQPAKAGEVHYALALLYEQRLNDPVSALHHYRRSMKSNPLPSAIDQARAGAKRMEVQLAARVANPKTEKPASAPAGSSAGSPNAVAAAPRAENAGPKPPTDERGFSKVPVTAKAERNIGAETRTHVVSKGETLASIARKYYKTPDRWHDILDANQNQLDGKTTLAPGMTLIVP